MTLVLNKFHKTSKTNCFVLFGVFLFTACNRPASTKYEINKIEIATGGCLRGCPVVGEIIDSTLTFKYYGGYKAKLQGYYEGKVSQGFWDTLNLKIKQISFKKLDTSKYMEVDGEAAEAIFYWNNHKRHVFKSIYNDPDAVSHVLIWIINSYKTIELHKLKDSVSFETGYQFMLPPRPKSDQVKFPPPKKYRYRK